MYPVVIPSTRHACSATLALVTEGLEVTEYLMRDRCNYGRVVLQHWQVGGFIVVEHDIVPWPGAITQLQECPEDWCAFEYPMLAPRNIQYPEGGSSLGCTKFSDALTRRYEGPQVWGTTSWDELDGQVLGMLREARERVHIHTPRVAHVRAHVVTMGPPDR